MNRLRPDRLLPILIALALGAPSARAEDFSGFYAGVNAGYAFDRERHQSDGQTGVTPTASGQEATGLPPSALSASQSTAMRASRSERPTQR